MIIKVRGYRDSGERHPDGFAKLQEVEEVWDTNDDYMCGDLKDGVNMTTILGFTVIDGNTADNIDIVEYDGKKVYKW